MKRAAVLGSGGMGTALAVLLANSLESISIWCRDSEQAAEIESSRSNIRRLPGVLLPGNVTATARAAEAVEGADFIVVAIPSAYVRATLSRIREEIPSGVPILSVVKGIENETFATPSRIIAEVVGDRPICVLSGPSHAEEMARGLPASVVLGGDETALNLAIRDRLNQRSFRVYMNPDVLGVELAGALKNVLGIAAGVCDGLGLGDNAKAALLTRGLVEVARFATALGANPATFSGLAGVGDVLTTCYSPHGRNRALGERIGKGCSPKEAIAESSGVVEGVPTTKSVHDMAQDRNIEMPITSEVYAVIFEGKKPTEAVSNLMNRLPKIEWT
jgi:glycerol-3-phosphate dehydrogenase (NAD(P)+)